MSRYAPSGEIADPAIIRKIISDLSDARAEGIIRPVQERKLGVRFAFGDCFFNSRPPTFLLGNISDHGLARLQPHTELIVEVFGTDKRIAFTCSVLQHTPAGLYATLPVTLSKAERRIAQRFKTNEDRMPFIDPKTWLVDANDIAAPPVFGMYQPLASWAAVSDISFGGVCIETRFPSLLNWIEANPNCTRAQVIFPMMKPIPIGLELRWTKRIRERTQNVEAGYSIQKYKMGMAFLNPPREFMLEVGRYIKELQMGNAV
jgi:hypothetical protein